MKNTILKIVFLASVGAILTLSSCKKEVIYPSDQLPVTEHNLNFGDGVNSWGKFVIIDASMWVEDKETGVKTRYNHFSPTKSRSSLRWGAPLFDIETIIKDTTTYSFWKPTSHPGTGKFELNGDSTKFYQINYIGGYHTIIEDATHGQSNLGGSARPFSGITIDLANEIVGITIQEMEGVDGNGHAIHYFSELTLKKIQTW